MLAGCYQGWNGVNIYAKNIPIFLYAVPPDDEQIVLENCTGC
jgi:hypothetical protein